MAAPPNNGNGQYPPQQYGEQPQYPVDPAQQAYGSPASPPPAAASQHGAEHGKKKKRAYAAQAFEVATGGNAVVGGQPAAAQYGIPQPAAPGFGGYPAQDAQQVAYGAPQPAVPGVGGYQAPDAYYSQGVPPAAVGPAPGGVAGITAGIQSMGFGGQPQQPQQLPAQTRGHVNQLYPTDLLNQPFNVAELELPPPPIILPPNVSSLASRLVLRAHCLLFAASLALPLPQMPTARQSMCDRP